jgi:hypothetical protein
MRFYLYPESHEGSNQGMGADGKPLGGKDEG